MTPDPAPAEPGLIASLHRLAGTLLRTVATRLEILSTEVAEERFNLARLAMVALAVLFCFQVVGEANRVAALGIASLVLLLAGAGGALWLRGWLKSRTPMFGTTIAELRKDAARIRGDA